MTLRRFVTVRGYPRKMISDSGSQLVAAGKELQQVVHKWDWEPIKSFGKCKGMDWVTTKSADAPWENGVSESLVKSVKKSLEVAIGTSVMTFSELQTVLFEVSNLLNERPIGTKNSDPTEGSYLCPNDLLLGRSSIRVPNGNFNENSNYKLRWKFIQQVVQNFLEKMDTRLFSYANHSSKMAYQTKECKVGDLVIVQDSNIVRGRWKMAQII
ncbi:Hypothetical predicted protein [Mytilus galloprovincialis]|uniref:Integrase catalytic domain-containing protein n=1 Tax=Mytilus galloprovincialis TaxID=29158 RepID=A0A8B6FDC0_MYTGA|nr:Hypothetical predicted protein [Mytilus galloprovincialis]